MEVRAQILFVFFHLLHLSCKNVRCYPKSEVTWKSYTKFTKDSIPSNSYKTRLDLSSKSDRTHLIKNKILPNTGIDKRRRKFHKHEQSLHHPFVYKHVDRIPRGWPISTIYFPPWSIYDCVYRFYICTERLGSWPENSKRCSNLFDHCNNVIETKRKDNANAYLKSGTSIQGFVGIWSFVSNVTSNSTGDINIEAAGVNLYFQCDAINWQNLECVLAGVTKSNSSTHSFIIRGQTISLADYPNIKGTLSKQGVIDWDDPKTPQWIKGEPCHKEVTCSIEGEFCVNDTCKCGVFGGPSCEGKTTGDYCKADFSTCSCSADSLGECPSGYSCDTRNDTCVRSND